MFDFLKKLLGMGGTPTDNTLSTDMGSTNSVDEAPVVDNAVATDEQVADAVDDAVADSGSDSSND